MCLQMGCIIMLPTGRALLLVGLVSSGCSFVSATSLVTTVPEVIRTKCSKSLVPRPVLLCAHFSSVLWVACGVTLGDEYIIAPNICSLFITTFAMFLSWYYPKYLEEDEEEDRGFTRSFQGFGDPADAKQPDLAAPPASTLSPRVGGCYGSMGFARAAPRTAAAAASATASAAPASASQLSLSSADGETGGTPIPPAMWPPSAVHA